MGSEHDIVRRTTTRPARRAAGLARSSSREVARVLRGTEHIPAATAGARVARALKSSGHDLPGAPHARLHVGGAGAAMAARMGVPAFTVGTHIFAAGGVSRRVLIHELAHVEQARRGASAAVTLEPARRRAAEHEARDAEAHDGARGPVTQGGLVHFYGEAGHYFTVYLVALAAGFDDETAFRIAFYAQMPDEVSELDAKHMGIAAATLVAIDHPRAVAAVAARDVVQRGGHALTGRPSAEERARRDATTRGLVPGSQEFGLSVHAFGDSYAHSTISDPTVMYQHGFGHGAEVSGVQNPDRISARPVLYQTYVLALYRAMVAAGSAHPEHRDAARDVGEAALRSMASEISFLPEDRQIAYIQDLAARRLARPMDPYDPTDVDDRPFARFRSPTATNRYSPRASAAAAAASLPDATAFMARQDAAVPPPSAVRTVLDPLNLSGFAHDVANAGVGAAAREYDAALQELDRLARPFFRGAYGYYPSGF